MITIDPENSTRQKSRHLHINRILRILLILITAIAAGSVLNITIAPVITTGGTVDIKGNGENSTQKGNSSNSNKQTNKSLPYRAGNSCSGDEYCTACKNCNACKNCHELGGTCGKCTSK